MLQASLKDGIIPSDAAHGLTSAPAPRLRRALGSRPASNSATDASPRSILSWEDADVLVAALGVQPGDRCLSVASGGDNTLSLLVADAAEVVAVAPSASDRAMLELKVAAFETLNHWALLELLGLRESRRRRYLYRHVREALSPTSRSYWDERSDAVDAGLANTGCIERKLSFARRYLLPLFVGPGAAHRLRSEAANVDGDGRAFVGGWAGWRWRAFARRLLQRLASDLGHPTEISLPEEVLSRFEVTLSRRIGRALSLGGLEADPYLSWIFFGQFRDALPHALRAEHFDAIRGRLDRLRIVQADPAEVLDDAGPMGFDRLDLSSVCSWMQWARRSTVLSRVDQSVRRGGRAVMWSLRPSRELSSVGSRLWRVVDRVWESQGLFAGPPVVLQVG